MNTTTESIDLGQLLGDEAPFGREETNRLRKAIAGPQLAEIRRRTTELQSKTAAGSHASDAMLLKAGVASYLLGNHAKADEILSQAAKSDIAAFYHGLVLLALERCAEAEQRFAQADKLGYDHVECTLQQAGALRAQGKLDEAEKLLRSVSSAAAGRAEYSFQMGCIWADRGDVYTAVEYFERAVDMDPKHSRALFRLAVENSNRGNDEEAIRLYEQSLSRPPQHMGAMLNLGLLYEDAENYRAAAYCFRRILSIQPTNERARLYLKDIEATDDMYYDEDSARNKARMEQLLGRPITDFELSMRSRNCLHAMNIHTLGDLTRVTEHELLAGKNFGETSLEEIRAMLAAHGLAIGENLHHKPGLELALPTNLSPDEQAQLNRPLSDLALSVRAKKCTSRLGLATVGELIQHTADELLSIRNFGVTSLNEIRIRLGELGLKLRND